MRINDKEIALKSEGKGQMEGRLHYKKLNSSSYYQSIFKERWFKLIDNFLFYFRVNDIGKIDDKQPAGVFVLENASIQMEHELETPFAFSISFIDEPEKRHMFSGMSEAYVLQWVTKLRCASYEYLRSQLYILQSKIYSKTGKDPLLMVPRNEGSMKWAPGEPLPCENHLPVQSSDLKFYYTQQSSSHIIRSKSFVNVLENVHINQDTMREDVRQNHIGLERSKTTAHVFSKRQNPFNSSSVDSIKTNNLRPAPSPPARKKNSPQLSRNITSTSSNSQSQPSLDHMFSNELIHPDSILSVPPKPPQRKTSSKSPCMQSDEELICESVKYNDKRTGDVKSEDLIQF